jgi:hypothetical protein
MALQQKFGTTAIVASFILGLFALAATSPTHAQALPPATEADLVAANDLDPDTAFVTAANDETPLPADPSAQTTTAPASKASSDDQWHFAVTPYLWFPAFYGTIGLPNRDLDVHASAGKLLSHFRFGLMGEAEVRRKWLLLGLGLFWVRLGDDKAIPLEPEVVTANVKAQEFMLTPTVGIRFVDQEKIKVDFFTGFRFWHLGTSLNFNPSALGLSFSKSANWVDPMIGGRIKVPLSDKIVANIIGDVGGWGTGSQIEYDVAGLLGYQIKPTLTLQMGYRYLRVVYRSGPFLFNVHEPGILFGLTWAPK